MGANRRGRNTLKPCANNTYAAQWQLAPPLSQTSKTNDALPFFNILGGETPYLHTLRPRKPGKNGRTAAVFTKNNANVIRINVVTNRQCNAEEAEKSAAKGLNRRFSPPSTRRAWRGFALLSCNQNVMNVGDHGGLCG